MTKRPPKTSDSKTEPQEPRSYVVRVYRGSLNRMVGQVEDVQSGLIRTFRSAQDLWKAIGGAASGQEKNPHTQSENH